MNIIMTVRSSCELETYIIAVERIKEYSELPSEVCIVDVYVELVMLPVVTHTD